MVPHLFSVTELPPEFCSARNTPEVPLRVHFISKPYGLMSPLNYPCGKAK